MEGNHIVKKNCFEGMMTYAKWVWINMYGGESQKRKNENRWNSLINGEQCNSLIKHGTQWPLTCFEKLPPEETTLYQYLLQQQWYRNLENWDNNIT